MRNCFCLFFICLILLTTTSCSKEESVKVDGVNIVGLWAIFCNDEYNAAIECNISEDKINYLYGFNSDGTYDFYEHEWNNGCPQVYENGYINCDINHFEKSSQTYSWEYKNDYLYIMSFPTKVKKVNDDVLKVYYDGMTYTLMRVKGFRQTEQAPDASTKPLTSILKWNGNTCDIVGNWVDCNFKSDGTVQHVYAFENTPQAENYEGYWAYVNIYDVDAEDKCSRIYKDGTLNCSLSHMDVSTVVWRINYFDDETTLCVGHSKYTVTSILSNDEIFLKDKKGNELHLMRIKNFAPLEFDGRFKFNDLTLGLKYTFDAWVTAVCSVGIIVSNYNGNVLIYDKDKDWSIYKKYMLLNISGTATNYYGSLEFTDPYIEVINDRIDNVSWYDYSDDYLNEYRSWYQNVRNGNESCGYTHSYVSLPVTLYNEDGSYRYYCSDESLPPLTLYFPSDAAKQTQPIDGGSYTLSGFLIYYNKSKNYVSILVTKIDSKEV